jgi:hypothetical protein
MKLIFILVSILAYSQVYSQSIPKVGNCPTGYRSSGNYCISNSKTFTDAFVKSGQCPTGYYQSSKYCVRSK